MKRSGYLVIAFAMLAWVPAHTSIAAFKHIVVIIQENRTPDNLFHELCSVPPASCGTGINQYDILTSGWSNYGNGVNPVGVDLAIQWGIDHRHDPD